MASISVGQQRNYNLKLLQEVIEVLRIPEQLEEKYKNHNLAGNYNGFKECHILPDWLLIYRYNKECLELARTGTHSDLFIKKTLLGNAMFLLIGIIN